MTAIIAASIAKRLRVHQSLPATAVIRAAPQSFRSKLNSSSEAAQSDKLRRFRFVSLASASSRYRSRSAIYPLDL
jgi:hypothetical protein